jgi:hypothetical protein
MRVSPEIRNRGERLLLLEAGAASSRLHLVPQAVRRSNGSSCRANTKQKESGQSRILDSAQLSDARAGSAEYVLGRFTHIDLKA